jgi:hypothetical protein
MTSLPLILSSDGMTCDINLYAYNSRMTEQIFIKFVIDIMPIEAIPDSYFFIPYS